MKSAVSERGRNRVTVVALILALILFSATLGFLSAALIPSAPNIIQPGTQVVTPTFTIFKDGANVFARNGRSGAIDFTGNAYHVFRVTVNATTAGGLILVKAGNYTVNGQIFIGAAPQGSSGITFAGEGPGATLLYFPPTFTTDAVVVSSVNNITIRDLSIHRMAGTGSSIELHATYGSSVYNVRIDGGNTGSGILAYGSTSPGNTFITIQNNVIQNTGRQGILVGGWNAYVTIMGNLLRDIGWHGIEVWPSYLNVVGISHDVTIIGNQVTHFGYNFIGSSGIGLFRPTFGRGYNIIVQGNTITSTGDELADASMIYFAYNAGSYQGTGNVVIDGNIVNADPLMMRGIITEAPTGSYLSHDFIVSNNIVNNSIIGIDMLYAYNVQVIGNRVQNTSQQGMFIGSTHSLVSGNMVVNSGRGGSNQVGIELGLATTYQGTIIENNWISDFQAVKTQQYGIKDYGGAGGAVIQNNNVSGNSVAGITNVGTNTLVRYNIGYVTENGGNETAGGGTSFTFSHGMVANPAFVSVSFSANCGSWYWTVPTTTQITVTTTAACTGRLYWYAQTWTA